MRGRPIEVTWRQEDATEVLKGVYRRERDIELRTRLNGLWLLRTGRPNQLWRRFEPPLPSLRFCDPGPGVSKRHGPVED